MADKSVQEKLEKYAMLMNHANIIVYEYYPQTDTAIWYDEYFNEDQRIKHYMSEIDKRAWLAASERDRYTQFIRGMADGTIEVLSVTSDGEKMLKSIQKIRMVKEDTKEEFLLLAMRDITLQKNRERKYLEQARRDSMTGLYNRASCKAMVEHYLKEKTSCESCGIFVLDVDYFKGVNDSYGHLFGDKVLIAFSNLLMKHFADNGIVARVGGDEFVVLIRNIEHTELISQLGDFIQDVRTMAFEENDYIPTCSIGVCYVAKNVTCSDYEQVFGNADWALYEAKKQGKNRYVFCDNMYRFQEMH